ncbi:hypothetical protein D9M71_479690 [compost metagenome]
MLEQLLQPLAEGRDPAGPVAAVAALANGAGQLLGIGADLGKTFMPGPFEQAVEEGAGVRPAGEAVNVAATGHDFTQLLQVGALVIEQLLRLGAVGRQGHGLFADAQGAVGRDPPVFCSPAFGLARR